MPLKFEIKMKYIKSINSFQEEQQELNSQKSFTAKIIKSNKFTFIYILYNIPRLIEFRTKLITNRKKLHYKVFKIFLYYNIKTHFIYARNNNKLILLA